MSADLSDVVVAAVARVVSRSASLVVSLSALSAVEAGTGDRLNRDCQLCLVSALVLNDDDQPLLTLGIDSSVSKRQEQVSLKAFL